MNSISASGRVPHPWVLYEVAFIVLAPLVVLATLRVIIWFNAVRQGKSAALEASILAAKAAGQTRKPETDN